MPQDIDFKQLVAGIGDGVIASDASGAIILWNAAAQRIFGFTEAEALGQSLDLITPQRHQARHWEGYHRTMATGITKYGNDLLRVPATHKDGGALSIAFTVSMLYKADGSVAAIVAVIRDDTSRFNEERAFRKRIAELEARLAAQDKPA